MYRMFKKTFSVLLALVMLLSLFACGKTPEKKEPESEPQKSGLIAWATHLTDKQRANVKPKDLNPVTAYDVYMTRGETEGCQLIVYTPEMLAEVAMRLASGENDSIVTKTFVMNKSHTVKRKEYTDSAIPYSETGLTIQKRTVLPFIVEFTTTADTPAGDYTYTYEFYDSKNKVTLATYTVSVHVWDIVLPEDKTFATAIDLRQYCLDGMGEGGVEAYENYYNTLLEHNLSAYKLPYDILDERADAYMSDPRVTSFVVGAWEADEWDDETLLKYYNKLKQNPVWLEKAMFYVIDEPRKPSHIEEYKAFAKRLQTLCPGIELIAPFYTNIDLGGEDQVDAMAEDTILWCPKLCLWDDENAYKDIKSFTPTKSFAERMQEFQAEGDTVWSYVCNNPITPYAQLFIDTDGLMQRLMMWQFYQRGIEGFLYWAANAYKIPSGGTLSDMFNPWETAYHEVVDGNGAPVYGEGYVLYPGIKIGMPKTAIPSIRLKILRDGIDDIELMYLAEKYLGRDWVMEKVNEATPTLTSYTSEENFYKLRKEIGDALEKVISNK